MPLPSECDLRQGIRNWGELGNDRDADCVPAATEHLEMVHNLDATSTWKKLLYRIGFRPPHAGFTLELYTQYLATQGEKPGPDVGVVQQNWFTWLKAQGKIVDFEQITAPPITPDAIKQLMIEWKGCLLGLFLTENAYQNYWKNESWDIRVGEKPNPALNHAVALVSYHGSDYGVVTWGQMKTMTESFLTACVYGVWVFK